MASASGRAMVSPTMSSAWTSHSPAVASTSSRVVAGRVLLQHHRAAGAERLQRHPLTGTVHEGRSREARGRATERRLDQLVERVELAPLLGEVARAERRDREIGLAPEHGLGCTRRTAGQHEHEVVRGRGRGEGRFFAGVTIAGFARGEQLVVERTGRESRPRRHHLDQEVEAIDSLRHGHDHVRESSVVDEHAGTCGGQDLDSSSPV